MIDPKTIEQIQRESVEERLQIIELILGSLKRDIHTRVNTDSSRPFVVRHFSIGQDIQIDRDELYAKCSKMVLGQDPLIQEAIAIQDRLADQDNSKDWDSTAEIRKRRGEI